MIRTTFLLLVSISSSTFAQTSYLVKSIPAKALHPTSHKVYFTVPDSLGSDYLWESDGTTDGTFRADSIPVKALSVLDDHAYVLNKKGLAKIDGQQMTLVDTSRMVKYGDELFTVGNCLFNHWENWYYQKDFQGVKKIQANLENVALLKGAYYFNTMHVLEKFDPVTNRLDIIFPLYDVYDLMAAKDSLYFMGYDGKTSGLYASDGTWEGTKRLMEGYYTRVTNVSPFGYTFTAWRSEGAYSFVQKGNTNPYYPSKKFGNLTLAGFFDFNGRYLLLGLDSLTGWEPYLSDGTVAGTTLLKDIQPGKGHGIVNGKFFYSLLGDQFYFTANDGVHGTELWVTDGTSEGTHLVGDVNPAGDADPQQLTYANDRLFFTAASPQGRQLWAVDATPTGWAPDAPKTSPILLMPNPSNGLVALKFSDPAQIQRILLCDLQGRTVGELPVEHQGPYDLSHLPKGLYLIKTQTQQEHVWVNKLVLR